ncbi:uncharacterized protein FIBRA_04357 [Fibroporia radiculosa]|uniref:Uncharacterized protein n=1 Tax=Fibroporia radiculosa TaxID=599839 RepID=J4HWH5_9APHY|nr:uncharacterized protein FIBRA_04357 [Fibroporia radiculosa]CCM02272.1 predicted protein [Fibroporia radiculosa]
MNDSTYPLFSVFAFLGFLIALVPLPWHIQGWNSGTCIYMLWSSFACMIQFVDSVVWSGNVDNPAPVWCDISTKFLIGAGVGIPAASLCINRRLFKISRMNAATVTRKEKLRAVYEDLAIGVGIPILVMVLHYVVQGHRFNILENVGCTPDIWNTPPAYPLVLMWPILLGCVSFIYASLTLRAFWRRRAQFSELLAANSSMSTSRYFRLMLLCCVEMACTVPLSAFSIYINNMDDPIQPYVSWANAHYNFSFVEQIAAIIWTSNRASYISVELSRWIYPFSAFLFFALFGFAEEARRHYRMAFWAIAKRLGYRQPPQKKLLLGSLRFGDLKKESKDQLPPYTPSPPIRRKRQDSLLSSHAGSFINIDLEKALPSPASTSATLAAVGSPTDSEITILSPHLDYVELRDSVALASPANFPVHHPSSPRQFARLSAERVLVPPYHRPFSPPTICPMPASQALAQCTTVQVSTHTEAAESA